MEEFYLNGVWDRNPKDGPARVIRNKETREIVQEEFYCEGKHHRDGGPAMIVYFPDKNQEQHYWFSHGMLHRGGGDPAEYTIDTQTGEITYPIWCLRGVKQSGKSPEGEHNFNQDLS